MNASLSLLICKVVILLGCTSQSYYESKGDDASNISITLGMGVSAQYLSAIIMCYNQGIVAMVAVHRSGLGTKLYHLLSSHLGQITHRTCASGLCSVKWR